MPRASLFLGDFPFTPDPIRRLLVRECRCGPLSRSLFTCSTRESKHGIGRSDPRNTVTMGNSFCYRSVVFRAGFGELHNCSKSSQILDNLSREEKERTPRVTHQMIICQEANFDGLVALDTSFVNRFGHMSHMLRIFTVTLFWFVPLTCENSRNSLPAYRRHSPPHWGSNTLRGRLWASGEVPCFGGTRSVPKHLSHVR